MNCRHPRGSARQLQSGAALVVAMLVFAICAALVVAMESEFTRFSQRAANQLLAEQAYAYLRGAEELAGLALLADFDQDRERDAPRDDLGELWAQPAAPYALDDGGWLQGSLIDLQGRFNLNALADKPSGESGAASFTAAQAQFIRLLQALGEPAVSQQEAIMITQAVGDWLDSDANPSPEGAEDDYYFSREPSHRVPNRPMASVSELRAVAYVTPEIYQALAPWVTVWPQAPATLNIHTAPAVLLRTINADKNLSPLSETDGQSLAEYREANGFADIDEFLENAVFGSIQEQMAQTRALLGQSTRYFLLEAEVKVADRNMRLYSVLERRNRQITAIARASGSL
jgi:general secretion pathway protein K